jgi:hypothetical protein
MKYVNASGQDRNLMVEKSGVFKVVKAGEVVEISDDYIIAGLEGQEALWEPVQQGRGTSAKTEG